MKPLCCVGGQVKHYVDYQLGADKGKLTAVAKFLKADVSSVSPSSEQSEGLWVVCVYILEYKEFRDWRKHGKIECS